MTIAPEPRKVVAQSGAGFALNLRVSLAQRRICVDKLLRGRAAAAELLYDRGAQYKTLK
jgi:hypothetical protein